MTKERERERERIGLKKEKERERERENKGKGIPSNPPRLCGAAPCLREQAIIISDN